MKHLKIYTDGGARGNPGPGAFGLVVKDKKDNLLYKHGEAIGKSTNNQAEYQGLIAGLEWIVENDPQAEKIDFFLDSRLIINQMQGNFKVKSLNLRPLWIQAKKLEGKTEANISYHLIPREENTEADGLVNASLDNSS